MTRKILAVIVCMAMLLTSISIISYAEDIVIDLSTLFDDDDTPPAQDNTDNTDDKNNTTDDKDNSSDDKNTDKDDNKVNTNKGNGTSKDDNKADEKEDVKPEDEKKEEPAWEDNPFTDIKINDWYYGSVKYAVQKGLFNGLSEDTFGPNAPLTRAMLVTILYRSEGSPAFTAANGFNDVADNAWYASSVAWASANGIVTGYDDGTFKPNTNITREQIATIIYRFASYKGRDVSKGDTTNIVSFYSDSMSVSSYAKKALQYTVGEGIMKGKTEKTLNPQDNATRAEAATILGRFLGA